MDTRRVVVNLPLGKAIRRVRKKRGLTQKDLALRMGMRDVNGVYQIERGRNNPQMNTFCSCAAALEIQPWELLYVACKLQERKL